MTSQRSIENDTLHEFRADLGYGNTEDYPTESFESTDNAPSLGGDCYEINNTESGQDHARENLAQPPNQFSDDSSLDQVSIEGLGTPVRVKLSRSSGVDKYEPETRTTLGQYKKDKPRTTDRLQKIWQSYNSWWWWEICGIILSSGGFVAAAILISVIHNKPLSAWTFPIGPNSLLSVFATISKTSLLLAVSGCISQLKWPYFQGQTHSLNDIQVFDDASRGPWGSLTFLLNLRVKDLKFRTGTPLAALATFITIATLAVDPFVQQILHYPLQTVETPEVALLHRTQVLDTGNQIIDLDSGCNVTDLYPGIGSGCRLRLSSNTRKKLDFHTAALSGLWSFASVGFKLDYLCDSGDCDWPIYTSLGICSDCRDVTSSTTHQCYKDENGNWTCNHTTPSDYHLRSGHFVTRMDTQEFVLKPGAPPDRFCDFGVMWAGTNSHFGTPSTSKLGASELDAKFYECSMSLCARTINTTVFNQTMSLKYPNKASLKEVQPFGLRPFNYSQDRFQIFTVSTEDPNFEPGFSGNFTVSIGDKLSLARAVTEVLTWIGPIIYNQDSTGPQIPAKMEAVAEGLSAELRQLQNNTNVTGHVYRTELYIQVQWGWFAYLAGVFGLSLLLLVSTILLNTQRRIQLWKASTTALIFSHVQEVDETKLELSSPVKVENTGKSMKAGLNWENSRGLEFVAS